MNRGIKKFFKIKDNTFVITKINDSIIITMIRGDFFEKIPFGNDEFATEAFDSINEDVIVIMYMSYIFEKNIKGMNSRMKG